MISFQRLFSQTALAGLLAASLAACSTPGNPSAVLALDTPAEYTGTVVGPIQWGQPEEGSGFKAFALEFINPVVFDDRGLCGEQTMKMMAIERSEMDPLLGKTVRLRATAYCRTNRTGKYHLSDVTVLKVSP
jgi:hypothetical protein